MCIVRRPLNRDCRGIYVNAEARMLQTSIKNCSATEACGGLGMWSGTSALLATDSVRCGRRSNISAWSLTAQMPHTHRAALPTYRRPLKIAGRLVLLAGGLCRIAREPP